MLQKITNEGTATNSCRQCPYFMQGMYGQSYWNRVPIGIVDFREEITRHLILSGYGQHQQQARMEQ